MEDCGKVNTMARTTKSESTHENIHSSIGTYTVHEYTATLTRQRLDYVCCLCECVVCECSATMFLRNMLHIPAFFCSLRMSHSRGNARTGFASKAKHKLRPYYTPGPWILIYIHGNYHYRHAHAKAFMHCDYMRRRTRNKN